MDESSFHERADNLLEETLEAIEIADSDGKIDVELQSGILTIIIEESEQEYVINKHEPSGQIWFSSPESGADKFSYDENDDEWRNSFDGVFKEILSEELAELAGIDVEF